MTESAKYFEEIRKKYPPIISKDQFYQIAHISKATALYLLQSGLVPCKDSGKRTRRYSIHIDDVIYYLINRELQPEKYRASDGWHANRSAKYCPRISFCSVLTQLTDKERSLFRNMIEQRFSSYDDVIGVSEVASMTGYSPTAVTHWCNAKHLYSFYISGKYCVPKVCLAKFMVSSYCFNIRRKSWKHLLLIKEFLDQHKKDSTY